MEDLIRFCGIIVTLLISLSLLRDKVPSIGLVVALAGMTVLVAVLIPLLSQVLDCIRMLMDVTGLDAAVFTPILRVIGICMVVKLMAELCRDAGERTLAAKVEMFGAAAGILCAVPLVEQALQLIRAF